MSMPGSGHLDELAAEACWTLLGEEGVGRIAWTGASGPTIVPVNYRVVNRQIQIRTAPYSALARETDDSIVAFEADDADASTQTGWSVLVRGRMSFDFHASADQGPTPWPGGNRPLHAVITPSAVTGRRLT